MSRFRSSIATAIKGANLPNRLMFGLLAALVGVLAIGGIVLATPSSGVTSTTIATGSSIRSISK